VTPVMAAGGPKLKTLGVEVGNLAPDFTFRDGSGKWTSLSDLRGKKVFLFSWATWCSCREQLPELEKFYKKYKSETFEVIAVASDSQGFKWVKPYLDRAGATFVALVDPNNELARKYNFDATENGFLIDKTGVIQMSVIGFDIRKPDQRDKLVGLISKKTDNVAAAGRKQSIIEKIRDAESKAAEKPNYFTAKYELSDLYIQNGNLEKAESVLREAISIKKQSAEAHYRLGVILYQEGKIEDAVAEWERAFKYEPTNYIYMRNIQAYKEPEKFYSEISESK
jgi:cytochrome c biogenesis protein CcmG, thiol:disulfide interchange protein DsbE